MKSNTILFAGLAAVVITATVILDYINPSNIISSLLWIASCAALSGIFFLAYLVNGRRAWGWFFPACIFAALSEILFILKIDFINDTWAFVFGLLGILIPALVAYRNQPRRANLLIAQHA